MKRLKCIIALTLLLGVTLPATAQVVRRTERREADNAGTPGVTPRMKDFFEETEISDAARMWERTIYRQIDLTQAENMALYFPEEPTEDQESLFRIILRVVTDGLVPAYEYLDGREIFNEQYQIKVGEMLERFRIVYSQGKGSTEKNPKYVIEESDVPTNEVLSYYAIEKWEFNTIENRAHKKITAICPVLHRVDDYGGEPIKYPMFWVKLAQLRPYLSQQSIFIDDDNNLPKYTFDDFFQLGLYKGEIYKTKNLRNQTLMQMFPDPDALKAAQDSIEARLNSFDRNVWVPTREELEERAAIEEAARLRSEGKSDDIVVTDRDAATETVEENAATEETTPKNKRSTRKKTTTKKKKKTSSQQSSGSTSAPVRSVRRTK